MKLNYKIDCNSKTSFFVNKNNVSSIYFNEVRRIPLLTETEERMLVLQFKNAPTEQERNKAKNKLIEANLRFVISIAKKLGTPETFLDLVSEGNIGLIKAIDHFDRNVGVKFSTYAVPMIMGEIRRFLRDNNSIRVSRSLKDIAYKAIYTKEAMSKKNKKEPTIEEISKEIGFTKEEIAYAMDAILSPVSLFEPVFKEGEDTLYVMDQISDKNNNEENWVKRLALSDAIKRLDEREKEIIERRFFRGSTQMEVASEIGISQAQVSRLEKSALRSMRNYLSQ